jgi:hypothetical protein
MTREGNTSNTDAFRGEATEGGALHFAHSLELCWNALENPVSGF